MNIVLFSVLFLFSIFKIGILVPAQHPSLDKIVKGFTAGLDEKKYQIEKFNAQGDPTLERVYAQKLSSSQFDYIIPIGTQTTLTVMAEFKKKQTQGNIMALAANLEKIIPIAPFPITGVQDELDAGIVYDKLLPFFTTRKKMALIYSPAEKILEEVNNLEKVLKLKEVKLQKIMAPTTRDLSISLRALHDDLDFILILKDHFIVTNVPMISKIAKEKKIPLVASDEGSLELGASFSIGIKEEEIGISGQKLLLKSIDEKIPFHKLEVIKL